MINLGSESPHSFLFSCRRKEGGDNAEPTRERKRGRGGGDFSFTPWFVIMGRKEKKMSRGT